MFPLVTAGLPPTALAALVGVALSAAAFTARVASPTPQTLLSGERAANATAAPLDGASLDTELDRALPSGAFAAHRTLSPDRRRLAFTLIDSAGLMDIYVYTGRAHAQGARRLQRITRHGRSHSPAWSPDGTQLAFVGHDYGAAGDIYVVDAKGGEPLNLTPDPRHPETADAWPAWSPDGARIAFASTLAGTYDIWTMRTDGTGLRKVTHGPERDLEPRWSADGSRIIARRIGGDGSSTMIAVRADGSDVQSVMPSGETWQPGRVPQRDDRVAAADDSTDAQVDAAEW